MDIKPGKFQKDYEVVFILSPEVSEEDYKRAVKKYTNLIKEAEGSIVNVEYWGVRKLAYPIRKKTKGYYAYIEFRAYAELPTRMEKQFIYDQETVLRFLTVTLDKHAVAYNIKRRQQGFGMRQTAITQ